jgi:hypothetical protein
MPHNQKVVGSNPAPLPINSRGFRTCWNPHFFRSGKIVLIQPFQRHSFRKSTNVESIIGGILTPTDTPTSKVGDTAI